MNKILIVIFSLGLFSCHQKKGPVTKIIFHVKWANNKKFMLEQIPFKEERSIMLDSGIAHGDYDSIVFEIPGFDERLMKVTAAEVNMSIMFVTDAPVINVYANYGNTDLFSFEGSPGSASLKQFMARQDSIAALGTKITAQTDSVQKGNGSKAKIDSLHIAFNKNLVYFFNQYKNFEDTIHSRAAFMALYNNVDFGNDYAGLKKFILKAAGRFPGFEPIQRLKTEALDMIKIYEEEYNVGDTLPAITLHDQYGKSYSTASLKGKYYLIDFWSGWCPQCMPYKEQEKIIRKKIAAEKLEIVSVAIDAEKENWKILIQQNHLNWPQLIDEKMWQGDAVKTLKFDSIPFNFLVSPQGKIIAKAIKPDSLEQVVSRQLSHK